MTPWIFWGGILAVFLAGVAFFERYPRLLDPFLFASVAGLMAYKTLLIIGVLQ